MEQQLLHLLAETQSPAEAPRTHAEQQLKELYPNEAFPLSLCSIASHTSVPLNLRQSALLILKTFVVSSWSPSFDEFKGTVLVSDATKEQLRNGVLNIATSNDETDDRKVKAAASYVVSKIASVDFPDQWSGLLPHLLQVIPQGTLSQVHGALKVLSDLVEDGLNEDQFFSVARDLVKVVFDVATNDTRKSTLRALAVSIFRGCFATLDLVMDSHRAAVKAFADEVLNAWMPFFVETMKKALPVIPKEDEESREGGPQQEWRGVIALKLQVIKTLMKIRTVFPAVLSPQTPLLFSATWEELSLLQEPYQQMYIKDERQGRLEDADGLPYTLDFLVLEELDFMQSCLRAPPVRKELNNQLQASSGATGTAGTSWLTEVMKLAVTYAQITTEEEGLWDIDVNVFLSEETSVTANYTARTACGDLVIKLGEWLEHVAVEGLLVYTTTLFANTQSAWKSRESSLYVLDQLLTDFHDVDRKISPEMSNGFAEYVRYALQQDDVFLRARGYLVAGVLIRTSSDAFQEVGFAFMHQTLKAISDDPSDVVKVAGIKVLQDYLQTLPSAMVQPLQADISGALALFFASQDPDDLTDSDDLLVTLVETLRDTIRLDMRVCIAPESKTLDLLFTLASRGARNFQLAMLVNETFEDVASSMAAMGGDAYMRLCEKVLPTLTGAFDVGNLTGENFLTNLAADLLSVLAEHGSEPLPNGFVAATMPKLNRLLLTSTDGELLRPGTVAVKYMLAHDHKQMFEWHDQNGKSGLEVCLVIIDRLLQEGMDDHAAAEVGGLAAELVEKAGSERLGPYLLQLLRAVAIRLASAQQAAFIQSLIIVFARLSLVSAKDVVDFLAQVQIQNDNALQVVMSKWLENSINFAGYDEIRQNVIALSKLFSLDDPRLALIMVQGDLIVPQSDRIMTRSKARQNPDRYTSVPVPLKIIKVLIEELSSASGGARNLDPASAALAGADELGSDDEHDEDDDNGEWEDVPNVLELGLGTTKAELMAYGEGSGTGAGALGSRQRDDETQAYLTAFFRDVSEKNVARFSEMFAMLTADEQQKLSLLGQAAG
ncbi:MAG: hypothetical protein M1838_001039 [Thelocarpon superellum]|nr:MAG: hypothetical protein M1838_001039 [Thelocarpon superellum]